MINELPWPIFLVLLLSQLLSSFASYMVLNPKEGIFDVRPVPDSNR